MRTVAAWLALCLLSVKCLGYETAFSTVEKMAEIESLSKQVDKAGTYVSQVCDSFQMQFAQLQNALDEIGSSDEEINALVASVASALSTRIEAAQAKYDSLFDTVAQLELDAEDIAAKVNNLASQRGLRADKGEPRLLHVDGYWNNILDHIGNLPNPIILKDSGFYGGVVSDAFDSGVYSTPCDTEQCRCEAEHGKTNLASFYSVLQALRKSSVRVETAKQHPPSF